MTDTRETPRCAFAIVFSIVLMNSIGFGIIVPVMPALIMDVADVDLAEAALLGGVLSVSYAIMQVFFAPVLGNLADAYGRKRVLLVSVFTFGIDFLVMAMAPVFAWLVVGRLIAGIASSTNSVANAYVADISPPEERAGNYGLMGAAFGVGFIVGPVIGGLLAEFGARAPFLGAAVLHLLHHRRGDRHCLAEGEQEVAGVAGGHFHQIPVLPEAEDVFVENDLYALRHGGSGTVDCQKTSR